MKKNIKIRGILVSSVILFGADIFIACNIIAPEKTYKIGARGPAGGWIFYDKGNSEGGWRYLEAAPVDQSHAAQWGCDEKSIPGAKSTAIGTGKSNTQAIVAECSDIGIAAKLCTAYRGGGKSDWFLPSKDEIKVLNTKLLKTGVGGFAGSLYWSSSEYGAYYAGIQNFGGSGQYHINKNSTIHVRAVRAF